MHVVISGGTGFVGQQLSKLLLENGHNVTILTRGTTCIREGIQYVTWLTNNSKPELHLEKVDAIVNLAGVSLNDGRWTKKQKKLIYNSRMEATIEITRIIEALQFKPKVLINASAVGIYPPSLVNTYTENETSLADDFLGTVVQHWENHAKRATQFNLRVAYGRFGVVLGKSSGALPTMVLPYKLFVGGTIGSGKQWVSWIHVEDAARALLFAIETEAISGAFNITAPKAIRMKEFGKTLAEVLDKPHWLPVPSIAMILALGEQSKLVLEGQHVLPTILEKNNFKFLYPTLHDALANIL